MTKPSVFTCTKHALDRVRERFDIGDQLTANQWVTRKINAAKKSFWKDGKKHFINGTIEIVTDRARVVTIMENNRTSDNKFVQQISKVIVKEIKRKLTIYRRQLNKAEIEAAEHNLNRLKARNPKIKALLMERMTDALDRRDKLIEEIKSLEYSAEHYGVEVE